MRLNKAFLWFFAFIKFIPSFLLAYIGSFNLNLSPIVFTALFFDRRTLLKIVPQFWQIILPVFLPFFLFLVLGVLAHGSFVIKPSCLLITALFGGLYLACRFATVELKVQYIGILSGSVIFSALYFDSYESSFLFSGLPVFHGLSGFGALSTPLYFYATFLSMLITRNVFSQILHIAPIFMLVILSFNSTDTLLYAGFCLVCFIFHYSYPRIQFVRFVSSLRSVYLVPITLAIFFSVSFSLPLLANLLPPQLSLSLDDISAFRLTLATQAYELFIHSPIYYQFFGRGLGLGYLSVYDYSLPIHHLFSYPKMIHNSVISLFVDLGLLGASFYFLTFYRIIFYLLDLLRSASRLAFSLRSKSAYYFNMLALITSFFSSLSLVGMDKYTDIVLYFSVFAPFTVLLHLLNPPETPRCPIISL